MLLVLRVPDLDQAVKDTSDLQHLDLMRILLRHLRELRRYNFCEAYTTVVVCIGLGYVLLRTAGERLADGGVRCCVIRQLDILSYS